MVLKVTVILGAVLRYCLAVHLFFTFTTVGAYF